MKNKKHLKHLIAYIHHNPSHHNYKISDEEYPWSSFKSFLSIKETKLKCQEVLKLYGGIDKYLKYHKSNRRILLLEDMLMEDLIY